MTDRRDLGILLRLFAAGRARATCRTGPRAPQNEPPDNLPKDRPGRRRPPTPPGLPAELREKQAKQAATYGWVDQKAGVVQLPIDRAMELIVKENGGAK